MKSTLIKQFFFFDSWRMVYTLDYIKFRICCVLVTVHKAGPVGAFYPMKIFLRQ